MVVSHIFRSVSLLAMLILCVQFASCSKNAPEPDSSSEKPLKTVEQSGDQIKKSETHFWLLVRKANEDFDKESFDDDKAINIGGGAIGGDAIVWINGSPIHLHTFGGSLNRITSWVRNGRNEVRVTGKHTTDIYVKIISSSVSYMAALRDLVKFPDHFTVLSKKWISSSDGDISMSFESSQQVAGMLQLIPSSGKQKIESERDLRKYLSDCFESVRDHSSQRFIELTEPIRIPGIEDTLSAEEKAHHNRSREAERKSTSKIFDDKSTKVLNGVDDLIIVWGKRSVLVYSKDSEDSNAISRKFIKIKYGDTQGGVGPVILAIVNNRWRVVRSL